MMLSGIQRESRNLRMCRLKRGLYKVKFHVKLQNTMLANLSVAVNIRQCFLRLFQNRTTFCMFQSTYTVPPTHTGSGRHPVLAKNVDLFFQTKMKQTTTKNNRKKS